VAVAIHEKREWLGEESDDIAMAFTGAGTRIQLHLKTNCLKKPVTQIRLGRCGKLVWSKLVSRALRLSSTDLWSKLVGGVLDTILL
jgi:hypothetical protein